MEKDCPATPKAPMTRRRLFNDRPTDNPLWGLEDIMKHTLQSEVINEMTGDNSPLKSMARTVSSSRLQLNVTPHPLRWNSKSSKARYTAHNHPLRLVHSTDVYPQHNGCWICDIHGEDMLPGYTFHCPQCLFDVCIYCVSKPCLNCTAKSCYHTQININMI